MTIEAPFKNHVLSTKPVHDTSAAIVKPNPIQKTDFRSETAGGTAAAEASATSAATFA